MQQRLRRLSVAVASLVLFAVLSPAAASAAPLGKVTLGINTHYPYQYTYIKVTSKAYTTTGAAMPGVKLTYRYYYKTTSPIVYKYTDTYGTNVYSRYISGATPGFKVVVRVTATKNGVSRTASNWFIPKRR